MIDQPLTVRTLPSEALFAKSEIALGKLRLSPVTGSVVLFNPRKKGNPINPRQQCTLKCPDGSTMVYSLGSPVVDENFCSAFFLVQVTHSKMLGNMALTHEEVPFIPAAKKLKIAGNEHSVKIPVFSSSSIIKPGEELLTFIKKEEKPPTPPVVHGLVHRPTKKAKVSSS